MPLALIGKICSLILLLLFFIKKQNASILLMLSGIAGGLLCLYAGVAYNLAIIAVVQTLIAFKTINLIKME